MPTLTFKATEMKEAKVARISLVDRAATRIPIKVIKQEKDMNPLKHLDLASVFKFDSKKVVEPEVVGVITLKSDGFDSVKGQIEEAGFSVASETALEDGSVVFGQGGDVGTDSTLIRISENAVLAIKGLIPHQMDVAIGDSTFAEVCKAQGFYPGVGSVIDGLRIGVLSLAEKSEDKEATISKVEHMFNEAREYAISMIDGLPSKAFKLEFVFPEEPTAKSDMVKCKSCGAECEADDTVCKSCGADPKAPKVKKEDSTSEGTVEGGSATGTEGTAAGTEVAKGETPPAQLTKDEVVTIVGDKLAEFSTRMESLLEGVTKSVSDATKEMTNLGARVESAEQIAKSAQKALEGTVVLGGASEAGDHVVVARKQEVARGGEIDTGFRPVARRGASR